MNPWWKGEEPKRGTPGDFEAAFRELYNLCEPFDEQPEFMRVEDVPQEVMDAAIADLED